MGLAFFFLGCQLGGGGVGDGEGDGLERITAGGLKMGKVIETVKVKPTVKAL